MTRRFILSIVPIALLSMLLAGCYGADGADVPATPAQTDGASHVHADGEADQAGHAVLCGCSIEEFGECGNFVVFDGQYVALEFPEEFGFTEMEFCGEDDLVALVDGEMADGKFVVTSFEYAN
jgi:predicted small secreted protein